VSFVLSPVRTELLSEFENAATAAAATVERLPASGEQLALAIGRRAKGESIAISRPLDLPPELFSACERLPNVIAGRSREELAACEVGVTDAFAGVARTGSVCVCVDHDYAGAISLVTRLHIVVLAADTLVERPKDLFDLACLDGKALTRNFVFITGPSATADMGPLVRGVHGPHRLHVILLV
jgi:L-lactate dehydrogenase complex protein LldG